MRLYFCLCAEAKKDPEKFRFQVELEFVQCLANPQYLNCRSAQGHVRVSVCVDDKMVFPLSSSTAWVLSQARVCALSQLSAILEKARILKVPQVRALHSP